MPIDAHSIKFGTDGWRGVIAADFTFDRLALVAPAAAKVLAEVYGESTGSRTIIVGHDRRFMAEDFAKKTAEVVQAAGFDVLLSEDYAPTPAFSWAAKQENALGALVLTASHNPGNYLGLKVKGAFGGSVAPEITQKIEALLVQEPVAAQIPGTIQTFNPWTSYCEALRSKVDISKLKALIEQGKLTVYADVMHGAAAGGLSQILGVEIHELNSSRDPLFGGGALLVGLVFDGDSDRIAAVDGEGNFLSPQILVPILIDHLASHREFKGEVVKTISGSDLIPRVAALHELPVYETPIGYKYIADRMLSSQVLLGGEESGGIGYGTHIPERDALLSALYLLEAIAESGLDLSDLYKRLQERTGYKSAYDRIDLHLASMEVRASLQEQLETQPLKEIDTQAVVSCQTTDGYKFRLANDSWLIIRFSGTEPLLRLYCEAPTLEQARHTLDWAKDWANSVG